MKSFLKVSVLVLSFIVLFQSAAEAQRPYVTPEETITDPNGHPLIVEKFHAGSKKDPDPFRVQIRNRKGAVIAATPATPYADIECGSLQSCSVTSYDPSHKTGSVWVLEARALEFETVAPALPDNVDSIAFKNYLQGDVEKFTVPSLLPFITVESHLQGFARSANEEKISSLLYRPYFVMCFFAFLSYFAVRHLSALIATKNAALKNTEQLVSVLISLALPVISLVYAIMALMDDYLSGYLVLATLAGALIGHGCTMIKKRVQ